MQLWLSIHGKHLSSSTLSWSSASSSALSMPWPLWPITIAIANCLRTNSGWVDEPKASCGHVFEQLLQKAKSYKANIALPLQKSNKRSTQKSTHITLLSSVVGCKTPIGDESIGDSYMMTCDQVGSLTWESSAPDPNKLVQLPPDPIISVHQRYVLRVCHCPVLSTNHWSTPNQVQISLQSQVFVRHN